MTRIPKVTGRRAFLLGLGTLAGTGAFTAAKFKHLNNQQSQASDDLQRNFAVAGNASLRDRAAAKGLIYGSQSLYSSLTKNPAYAARFVQECSMLVPGLELKWKALRPSPDRFDFTRADWMAEFAQTHGMLFRGHTLVWYKDLPSWFEEIVNSRNAEQVLLKHIATVAGHYAGRMHSWDVVNEAVATRQNKTNDRLRKSPWLEFLGPDYIDIAFRAAAEADPRALLVFNENSLESDTPTHESKRIAVLKLLERLKSNGTPVQALGIESHLGVGEDRPKFTRLRSFLSDVASLGLKILITELDVSDKNLPQDPMVRDRAVAQVYEDYLSVVLAEPAVISVITWGISDRYTWRSKQAPREDGAPVRPLPFDAELRPKLAYNAIARAFEDAPKRDVQIGLPEQTAFGDVQGHWAQAYIQVLAARNIISGFPNGTFRPNAPVTRAEFAAIVAKAFTSTQRKNSTTAFLDVSQSFWAYNAIQTAAKSGFMAGYPDGMFQPNQQIPRVQVLVSLASGLNLGTSDLGVLSFYQDAAQIPAYAIGKVAAATQRKIVVNYPKVNQLNPNQEATRAEVAAFVHQALVSAGKVESISSPYVVQVTSPS
jgi:endo-1,4-beta-xylanase